MKFDNPPIAFFGHHKCATTWIGRFVDYVCRMTGRRTESLDNARQYGGDLGAYQQAHGIDFLFMRNARWSEVESATFERAVHLIRDPRDILVSGYFSHRNSHPEEGWPELRAHREYLQKVGVEEGLLAEIRFSASVFEDIATWNYEDDRVLEMKFERLVQDPYSTIVTAFMHLGVLEEATPEGVRWQWVRAQEGLARRLRKVSGRVPLLRHQLPAVPVEWLLVELHRHRFSVLAGGRAPGVENVANHYRKGVAGDWKNHFTDRVEAAFREAFGDLVEKLGYTEEG